MSNYNKVRGILKAKEGLQFGPFVSNNSQDYQGNHYIFKDAGEAQPLPTAIGPNIQPLSVDLSKLPKTEDLDFEGFRQRINGYQKSNIFKKGIQGITNFGKKAGQEIGKFVEKNPQVVGSAFDILGNSFGNNVTNSQGVNNAFALGDFAGDLAMKVNPIAGIAVKGGMAALKGINDLGGKYSDNFSINQNTASQIGGSYQGSVADFNIAQSKASKKYGLFSNGSRKKANRQIREATRQQNIMTDIANENQNYLAMSGNDLNYLRYGFEQDGGYDQRYMRVAKQGTKLQGKIDFIKERRSRINSIINLDSKEVEWQPTIVEEIESFKEGGIIESSEEWTPTIVIEEWEPTIIEYKDGGTLEVEEWEPVIVVEEFQNGGLVKPSFEDWFNSIPEKHRNNQYDYKLAYQDLPIEMLLNHAKDPYQFHLKSVSSNIDENGRIPFLKLGTLEENSELKGELIEWYEKGMSDGKPLEGKDKETWEDFKSKFEPKYIDGRYYYVPKQFKDGGKTKEKEETPEIEETTQKNIIPEGALHKNKHHIEHTDGLTQKGIPVVDNDGQQQAEVECEEIIFTLEVTKALEERYHKYYSDELTQKEKDELAIEAGKLLVKEILYNTDDRVGLIEKCEKGGKL